MVSSIILFATIFFIFGCVLGRLWQKYKQSTKTPVINDTHLQPSQTEHASSTIDSTDQHVMPTVQDLEMTENVAYGPLKRTTLQLN